jgi:hypothetical protein
LVKIDRIQQLNEQKLFIFVLKKIDNGIWHIFHEIFIKMDTFSGNGKVGISHT